MSAFRSRKKIEFRYEPARPSPSAPYKIRVEEEKCEVELKTPSPSQKRSVHPYIRNEYSFSPYK